MRKTIFMMGVDDTNSVKAYESQINKGGFSLMLPGSTPIHKVLDHNEIVKKNKIPFIIGFNKKLHLNNKTSEYNLFNLIANPDSCNVSLSTLEKILEKNTFAKIFNHPVNIRKTARETLPSILKGIEGVRIASVTISKARSTTELLSDINKANLDFPLIIRKRGFHNSQYMHKADSRDDLEEILPWIAECSDFELLPFIETLNPQIGYYQKGRVAVIDGKFYPQHFVSTDSWLSHSRDQGMATNQHLRDYEAEFIKNFNTDFLPIYQSRLEEIHHRIGLDYYGIDFAIDEQNNIVVFEANACMKLLKTSLGKNNEYSYMAPVLALLEEKLCEMLFKES